ncbi:MAG: ureidoglycolate lyase [Succinivibrio sp.]|nr:ureidoglycolate lyase [Succinivibrio sp.]
MHTIKAQPLTAEKFKAYGSFYDLLHPTGHHLGDFYHDHLLFPVSGTVPMAFSSLIVNKQERMIVTKDEYHDETGEISLCLDGDVIIHVAPPSTEPVTDQMEAFIVPKGTIVAINPGVWHMCSLPVTQSQVHILIGLPERTYKRDCTVVEYNEDQQVEIVLN